VICSSQKPPPDNTQQSQVTNIYALGGIRTQVSAGKQSQTHALNRAATWTGRIHYSFLSVALRPKAGPGHLILEVSTSHTTTHHSRYDSSGRMISSSQRPLPINTQHSQQTNFHAPPVGFEPTISAGERPQTYALDRATTGTGGFIISINKCPTHVSVH
jgi:hypothetical protein